MRGIKKLSSVSVDLVGPGRVGSTLEIYSRYKNKNIGFYPKCLRPFLRILCVVDDSMYTCRRNCSCARSQLYNYSN